MTTDIIDTSIVHYFHSGIQVEQIKMLIIFFQATFEMEATKGFVQSESHPTSAGDRAAKTALQFVST